MSASHPQEQIAPYAFGALEPAEQEALQAHLATCPECAELAAEAESLATLLPYSVTPYQAPTNLRSATMQRVQAQAARGFQAQAGGVTPGTVPQTLRVLEPPTWARTDPDPWWKDLLLRVVPWVAAAVGWTFVAMLVIYSHGQSDRLATEAVDTQSQIAGLRAQRDRAQVVQGFLATPGARVVPLIYQAGKAFHTTVSLIVAPGYIHGVVVARGLAVLDTGHTYGIWGRTISGAVVSLGSLTTSGTRAEGVSLIVGQQTLDSYKIVGMSIDRTGTLRHPDGPLIFTARLAQFGS